MTKPSPTIRVVSKHHPLVRLTHWVNVPVLLGLIASGLAIYWAAPVFFHRYNPELHSSDYLVDLGTAFARSAIAVGTRATGFTIASLGRDTRRIAALALGAGLSSAEWQCTIGLARRRLARADAAALRLRRGARHDALLPGRDPDGDSPPVLAHPDIRSSNALQRAAYFSMSLFGVLVVLSGWAMHKPSQLGWLERMFVSYNGARVVHFVCMIVLGGFVIPHVILAIADGWDTLRSMVVGWSTRVKESSHGR